MASPQLTLDTIVALSKRRGFVYPTSEIYGGLANSYDYGPLGAELLRNIRNAWWREFITKREDMVGLDSAIMLHPQTWVASGHVGSFTDPLVEDKITHKRYRADHLIEQWLARPDFSTSKLLVLLTITSDSNSDSSPSLLPYLAELEIFGAQSLARFLLD